MPDSQKGAQDEEGYGIYVDEIGAGPYSQFERPSYVLENLKWGTPGLGNTGGTITWSILGAGQSLASNNPYTSAFTSVDPVFASTIRAAFDRWEQVANFDFVETANPATADVIVAFDELSGQSANTIGLAQYYFIGSRLTRSYISFDLNRRYRTLDGTTYTVGTASGSGLNLYTLALHEIGHSIGLGHEDDFDTVMSSISDGVLTDLTSDDIAGARAIYGTAGSTPPTVDDYAATTATTGAVTVGGSVTGRVDTTSDEDWFRITLTAGVSYRIDLRGLDSSGGTLLDPYVRLLNSGGSVLATDDDAGTGTDSQILFTATSSGTYYIAASGFDGEQGTYTLAVTTTSTGDDYSSNSSTTGAVAVGGSTTGRLETSTDTDWFAVTLTGNRVYRIDLRGTASGGGTLSDPYLRVRSSSGVIYASDDDAGTGTDALLTYTAAFTGVHYIEASAGASVTGTYTLSVTDNGVADDFAGTAATTGVVTAATTGTAVSGDIGTAGDTDWFRVSLTAGASYRFRLTNTTLPASHLYLRNSAGTALASDIDGNGNPEIVYTAATTGTYYLDARAATATATGTYTIAADNLSLVDDFAATIATTGTVTPAVLGTAVSGTIGTAGDTDWFRTTLTAGAAYRLRLTNGTLAAGHLYLRNSAGTVLTSDIDGNGNPEILYTPTVTGTYFLDARAATATGTGTYTVAIDNLSLADDYAATTATTGAITVGTTVTGNIGVAADVDWLRVTLTAGTLYQFDGRGSAAFNGTLADPTMQLLNSSGTVLRTDNDSGDGSDARILYTPTASGAHYVAMRSTSATATGTYTVGVTANPDDFAATTATTGVANVGSATSGIVERAGDRDWFRAILTAGTTYSIEVCATSPGSGIRWIESSVILHSSSGATLASDTRSGLAAAARLTYTPTTTGAFYIDALAFSTGVGAYTVTVTAGAAQQAPATSEQSGAAQQAPATSDQPGDAQQGPVAIAEGGAGITSADLAALTAPPAIDLWDLPAVTGQQEALMLTQPPAFTLLAPYEINSPEDEHRLANTARFDPFFQMQQRTAFDLLPIG